MPMFVAASLLSAHCFASDFSSHLHLVNPAQGVPHLVFEDATGGQHRLSDYRGSYILLNIWATWCGPCKKEMPSLERLQKIFDPQKLRVLALSEDRSADAVVGFYKTDAITHLLIAVDHAGIAPSTLHLRGLPTSLLIDPQGKEIARIEGEADWSSPEVTDYLRATMR